MPVTVTKVTIQYGFDNKLFDVVLNPKEIKAIVFEEAELKRLQVQQSLDARNGVPGVKAPVEHKFKAGGPFTATVGEEPSHATISDGTLGTSDPPSQARGLWWHTNGCTWFHPD